MADIRKDWQFSEDNLTWGVYNPYFKSYLSIVPESALTPDVLQTYLTYLDPVSCAAMVRCLERIFNFHATNLGDGAFYRIGLTEGKPPYAIVTKEFSNDGSLHFVAWSRLNNVVMTVQGANIMAAFINAQGAEQSVKARPGYIPNPTGVGDEKRYWISRTHAGGSYWFGLNDYKYDFSTWHDFTMPWLDAGGSLSRNIWLGNGPYLNMVQNLNGTVYANEGPNVIDYVNSLGYLGNGVGFGPHTVPFSATFDAAGVVVTMLEYARDKGWSPDKDATFSKVDRAEVEPE